MANERLSRDLAAAKKTLPKIPLAIFDAWLTEQIEHRGWPPESEIWNNLLRHRPLSHWQQLEWTKEKMSLSFSNFSSESRLILQSLVNAHFRGEANPLSSLKDGKKRIQDIHNYVSERKTLPGEPIVLDDDVSKQLEIVDGSHRLAVFFAPHLGIKSEPFLNQEQWVWVGRLPNSIPNTPFTPRAIPT